MKIHFLLSEVFILRDQNPAPLSCKITNTTVIGSQKACVPHRRGRIALITKPMGQCRWQLRIHKEAHHLGGCQNGVIRVAGGVGNRGPDILGLKIRKIPQDLLLGGTAGKHLQDILHTDTHPPDTGTSSALGGIKSNALHANSCTPPPLTSQHSQ